MKKILLFNFFAFILISCSVDSTETSEENENILQNQTFSENTDFIGVAYVGADSSRIDIGEDYNLVYFSNSDPIPFKNKSDEFEIEEISGTEYIVYPQAGMDVSIHFKNASVDGGNFTFSYKVQSDVFNDELFQPGLITIYEPENQSFWPIVKEIIKEIAKSVIVEKVSEQLSDTGESCTDQAIRACGVGNVQSVDEGGWFSGCSYTCK